MIEKVEKRFAWATRLRGGITKCHRRTLERRSERVEKATKVLREGPSKTKRSHGGRAGILETGKAQEGHRWG